MRMYQMFTKIVSALILCCLAGCTPQYVKKEPCIPVEIPVYKACNVQIPKAPDYAFDKTTPQNPLTVRVKSLMTDRLLSRDYENQLRALLEACSNPQSEGLAK